jgi:transcriptional regulator CBF1
MSLLTSLKALIPTLSSSTSNPDSISTMAPESNKRKRAAADQGTSRPSPSIHSAAEAAARAVAQAASHTDVEQQVFDQILAHNNATAASHDAAHHSNGSTPAAKAGLASLTQYHVPPSFESVSAGASTTVGEGAAASGHYSIDNSFAVDGGAQSSAPETPSTTIKPPVGSDEWHRIRRDNHKEGETHSQPYSIETALTFLTVERRRREAINEGIHELSKIVPGCEKNKGSILQRAVQYIGQLKENEQANIEKWTLEKLLFDQATSEMLASTDGLKAELDAYKHLCEENGLELGAEQKEEATTTTTAKEK